MRLLRTAGLVVLILGCKDSGPQPVNYFQGTITGRVTVKDVFQNTETVHLEVEGEQGNGCNEASVKVTEETEVLIPGDPAIRMSPDDLTIGTLVRVRPPFGPTDVCPLDITATSVAILGR